MKSRVRARHAYNYLVKSLCYWKFEAWKNGDLKAIKHFASRKTYKFLLKQSPEERMSLSERAYKGRTASLTRQLRALLLDSSDEERRKFKEELAIARRIQP